VYIRATCLRRQRVCCNIFSPCSKQIALSMPFVARPRPSCTHNKCKHIKIYESHSVWFVPQAGSRLLTASTSDTKFIIHLWRARRKTCPPTAPVKWTKYIIVWHFRYSLLLGTQVPAFVSFENLPTERVVLTEGRFLVSPTSCVNHLFPSTIFT